MRGKKVLSASVLIYTYTFFALIPIYTCTKGIGCPFKSIHPLLHLALSQKLNYLPKRFFLYLLFPIANLNITSPDKSTLYYCDCSPLYYQSLYFILLIVLVVYPVDHGSDTLNLPEHISVTTPLCKLSKQFTSTIYLHFRKKLLVTSVHAKGSGTMWITL